MDELTSYADRAELCSSELFSDYYPGAQLEFINTDKEYVSDFLNIEYLQNILYTTSDTNYLNALMIVAQTGKGKNFWVLHVFRKLAVDRGHKILYLCNRTALSYQQTQEAIKAVDPTRTVMLSDLRDIYEVGSITLMTYHKYFSILKEKGEAFFKKYSYCVADEAHFFCSDCLFNPDTEKILKSIPVVFRGRMRIYMTATPETVYDLIYWAEWNAISSGRMAPCKCSAQMVVGEGVVKDKNNSLPILRVVKFKYDYSKYRDMYFFKDENTILRKILEDDSQEKWIVFVNSKSVGKKMEEKLEESRISTMCFDRESRFSKDISIRHEWEYLQEKGNLERCRVLIATSVLDNGFSIKDKNVKNIVLFTEDRTEFIQELGRVRLTKNQNVKVYISKMTATRDIHPNTIQDILDIFAIYYGSREIEEYPYPDAEIKSNNVRAKHVAESKQFGFVGSEIVFVNGEEAEKYYINNIARYKARLLKKEYNKYYELSLKNKSCVCMLYKQKWFDEFGEVKFVDLDVPEGKRVAEEINKFCDVYLNRPMKESTNDFRLFSEKFQNIFCKLLPDDQSVNKGSNRKAWKHAAINSHFTKISERWNEVPQYTFEAVEKNVWILKKK